MKSYYIKHMLALLYVICICVIAMIFLVAIIDLLIAPFLNELILEPNRREWCGLFSQCASQTQVTFIEYAKTMALWKYLDVTNIMHRLKNAAILGFIIGICYVV